MQTPFLDAITKVAEKLPPDRDLAKFESKLQPGDILMMRYPKPTALGHLLYNDIGKQGPWTHTGLYGGDGKVMHMQYPVTAKGFATWKKRKGREDRLVDIVKKQNLLALRPRGVTDEEREHALGVARSLMGKKYDWKNFVRAGISPSKKTGKTDGKAKAICSALIARAYHKRKLAEKSLDTISPHDIYISPELKEVGLFEG